MLSRFLFDLQGKLGIHIAAILARTVRELGVSALRTAHKVDRLERVMRTPLALAGFGMSLNRKHANSMCYRELLAKRGKSSPMKKTAG
jgi:hypothetical protein